MSTDVGVQLVEGERSIEVRLPANVKASLEGDVLRVSGPMGECHKDISKIPVSVAVQGSSVVVESTVSRKEGRATAKTVASHVRNMAIGVVRGYAYRLKIAYSHFPMTIKASGGEVLIENFIGEKFPRKARIVGQRTKVSVQGDDVVVEGPCLEEVGQTAANIEQATAIREKDSRVFLDGVYIYERKLSAKA